MAVVKVDSNNDGHSQTPNIPRLNLFIEDISPSINSYRANNASEGLPTRPSLLSLHDSNYYASQGTILNVTSLFKDAQNSKVKY